MHEPPPTDWSKPPASPKEQAAETKKPKKKKKGRFAHYARGAARRRRYYPADILSPLSCCDTGARSRGGVSGLTVPGHGGPGGAGRTGFGAGGESSSDEDEDDEDDEAAAEDWCAHPELQVSSPARAKHPGWYADSGGLGGRRDAHQRMQKRALYVEVHALEKQKKQLQNLALKQRVTARQMKVSSCDGVGVGVVGVATDFCLAEQNAVCVCCRTPRASCWSTRPRTAPRRSCRPWPEGGGPGWWRRRRRPGCGSRCRRWQTATGWRQRRACGVRRAEMLVCALCRRRKHNTKPFLCVS